MSIDEFEEKYNSLIDEVVLRIDVDTLEQMNLFYADLLLCIPPSFTELAERFGEGVFSEDAIALSAFWIKRVLVLAFASGYQAAKGAKPVISVEEIYNLAVDSAESGSVRNSPLTRTLNHIAKQISESIDKLESSIANKVNEVDLNESNDSDLEDLLQDIDL